MKIADANGVMCSDHSGCTGTFRYTVNEVSSDIGNGLSEGTSENFFTEAVRRVVDFFKALMLLFNNFDQIVTDLKGYLNV